MFPNEYVRHKVYENQTFSRKMLVRAHKILWTNLKWWTKKLETCVTTFLTFIIVIKIYVNQHISARVKHWMRYQYIFKESSINSQIPQSWLSACPST